MSVVSNGDMEVGDDYSNRFVFIRFFACLWVEKLWCVRFLDESIRSPENVEWKRKSFLSNADRFVQVIER